MFDMFDPLLTLALSMHSGKGLYAILLGSGVSKSSGIPTGWDIVLDLIRKLARLANEDCEPDPEGWYRTVAQKEPDYSDILDQVTKSSAERVYLLRGYFEPTEQERQEGLKLPTPAHKAIAQLVAKGYIRVIVTTNFDRLLEQALAGVTVQPTVISTPEGVQGAIPITHSPCTLIKVHGDYLDARLKNTHSELSTYEQPLNELLDRVFDEFGLVVSGWSGEWDVALRKAIERCSTHRFGTYWTLLNKPSPTADKLIGVRRASVITIKDADTFFTSLAEKIQSIEEFTITDPVSPRVAVARLKRYIAAEDQRISLHDLLAVETERAHKGIRHDRFSTQPLQWSGKDIKHRLDQYSSEVFVLLPLMICGSYWASPSQYGELLSSLKRIADNPSGLSDMAHVSALRKYPALVLLYGMGIVAISRGKYDLLLRLFHLRVVTGKQMADKALVSVINERTVMHYDVQRHLPGRERSYTPLSDHLFEGLREHLREYVPDDMHYDETFDWFEYLLGLVYCDLSITPEQLSALKVQKEAQSIRGPIGRFIWKGEYGGFTIQQKTNVVDGQYPEQVAAMLRAGCFGSNGSDYMERYADIKRGFDAYIARVKENAGIYL